MDAVRAARDSPDGQYAWPDAGPSLERGDFDVIANCLEPPPDRLERLAPVLSVLRLAEDPHVRG